jgi:hypothetical protein
MQSSARSSYVVWIPFVGGDVPVANTTWYESRTHPENAAAVFLVHCEKGGGAVLPGMGTQVLCKFNCCAR